MSEYIKDLCDEGQVSDGTNGIVLNLFRLPKLRLMGEMLFDADLKRRELRIVKIKAGCFDFLNVLSVVPESVTRISDKGDSLKSFISAVLRSPLGM